MDHSVPNHFWNIRISSSQILYFCHYCDHAHCLVLQCSIISHFWGLNFSDSSIHISANMVLWKAAAED